MYVVTVEFELCADSACEFVQLIRENIQKSLQAEKGCQRFDVCIDPKNPSYVFLYEIYDDRAAFEAHLATEHFRRFEKTSVPMVQAKKVRLLSRLELISCSAAPAN